MWKTIYNKLEEHSLNPYPPGKHKGTCEERYCVVKENLQVPFFNSNKVGYKLMDIILYVPLSSYIEVEAYVKSIKAALKELTDIRLTGNETPVITDNDVKAYTTIIEYQILKKLEG